MTRDEALATLLSARSYCFHQGVAGRHPDGDFRAAFRDLNRLYVELKAGFEPGNPPFPASKRPARVLAPGSRKAARRSPAGPQIALFAS